MSNEAIEQALKYLRDRNYPIPADILLVQKTTGAKLSNTELQTFIKALREKKIHSRAMKQEGDYPAIRDDLWIQLYDAVYDYLSGTGNITNYKQSAVMAISQSYLEATNTGYVDGGGELPLDEDTAAWAKSELDAQLSYIDRLFVSLKQLRKEEDFDANTEAADHADGYAQSLDLVYNGAKIAGADNKMLTFDGSDGKVSCDDCQKYKGQRHKASWWRARGIIGPPFRSFECGGWECNHGFYDDDGEEFTV